MTDLDRAALRRALMAHHPWLAEVDLGPQAVTAGECDVCGEEARLVQPCGPPPVGVAVPDWALGRRCAAAAGADGWCSGHDEVARHALGWLDALPEEADVIARLWWLATGEVRPDPMSVRRAASWVAGALGDGARTTVAP